MDPALKRVLDTLPPGEPAGDPAQIELRVPFCGGVHIVHAGEKGSIWFGPWYGPDMDGREATVVARNLRTGVERKFHCRGVEPFRLIKGMMFELRWKGRDI